MRRDARPAATIRLDGPSEAEIERTATRLLDALPTGEDRPLERADAAAPMSPDAGSA